MTEAEAEEECYLQYVKWKYESMVYSKIKVLFPWLLNAQCILKHFCSGILQHLSNF